MALDPRGTGNAEHAIFAEANTADRTALVRRDGSWKAAARKRLDLQLKGNSSRLLSKIEKTTRSFGETLQVLHDEADVTIRFKFEHVDQYKFLFCFYKYIQPLFSSEGLLCTGYNKECPI